LSEDENQVIPSPEKACMQIDPSEHSAPDNYKLLTNLVVPRPIAWVHTVDDAGLVNLAPFSFFNAVSGEPLPAYPLPGPPS
jgi:flavin reductase (DIM6/NTAB) family NADH-FMN oxidoreductase RutF